MSNKVYPDEFKTELKSKNDIVSVVSSYIHLERKGNRFWGCCPFHHEKTPSFTVSEEDQFYYCFGCRESGDVIRFIEKIENCDFVSAVEILAKKAGIKVPEAIQSEDVQKRKNERDKIFKILDEAYKHYVSNLYLPLAHSAQEYIKKRGLTRREIDNFQLGYSLDWTEMINFLKSRGFSQNDMLLAGITQVKNDRMYDVMAERLIFPIFNSFGQCVGFSGRVLGKTDYAKYKNTAETEVFHKGKLVYGVHILKRLKQEGGLKNIILVEGQMDVISMHRAGFINTVATLGTSLTADHAKEIKRFSENLVVCYDGDSAGKKATLRGLDILKGAELNVKIAMLPEGKDPDEILKTEGPEVLREVIENAVSVTNYLILLELQKFNLNKTEEKAEFVRAALNILRNLETNSDREIYLVKIRELTGISTDVLRRDLEGNFTGQKTEKKEEVIVIRENGNIKAVRFILASLLYKKEFASPSLNLEEFLINPIHKKLLNFILARRPLGELYDEFDIDSEPAVREIIDFEFGRFKGNEKQYFKECLWLLFEQNLKEKQDVLNGEFKNETNPIKRRGILEKLSEITKKLRDKKVDI